MKTVKDIVSLLKEIADTTFIDIWIPSLSQNIKFKSLSAYQHKELLKITIANAERADLLLNKLFADIISTNCIDTNIDLAKLTIIDKDSILLHYRQAITPDITVEGEVFNVSSLIDRCKEYSNTLQLHTLTEGDVSLTLDLPTIISEIKYHIEPLEDTESSKEIKAIYLARAVFLEFAKSIKNLSIKNNIIDINSLEINDLEVIIDMLPYSLLSRSYTYISELKQKRREVFKIKEDLYLQVDLSLLVDL